MADIAAYTARVMALREPQSGVIKALAKEAAMFPSSVELIVDMLYTKIKNGVGKEKLAGWYLLDAVIKTTSFGRTTVAPRVQHDLVQLASVHIPWGDATVANKYERMVGTWRELFGDDDVGAILSASKQAAMAPASLSDAHMPQQDDPNRQVHSDAPPQALPEPPRVRVAPARQAPRERVPDEPGELGRTLDAWDERPEVIEDALRGEVPLRPPTKDEIAPPMPVQMPVPVPRPQPNAPQGHIKAPPVDHSATYLRNRKANLQEILKNAKRKRGEKDGHEADTELDPNETDPKKIRHAMKKKLARLVIKHRFIAPKVDEKKWPKMPASFPRDPETDVQIGNYVDGVVFLRDAVREAGGALELSRLNNKIPEIKSLSNRIKSVREFIDVHTPTTFQVTREEGRIVVRLSEDPPPQPGQTPSWLETPCPECGKIVPGHNLPKHQNSKMCVGMQMLLGKEGKGTSTVAQISQMSYKVLENTREYGGDPKMDDDDLAHLAALVDKAGDNFRTKYSRKGDWSHVYRSLWAIHKFWLTQKNIESSVDVTIEPDDGPMVKFLSRVGKNLHCLPISYLDFGEFEAMAGPFIEEYKAPPPKPARFGSTKIRPKECVSPGFVFCDSDRDSDNPPDSDRESEDDYDKEEDHTAPLTMSQVLATVGTNDQKDKKKLLQMAASTIEWKMNNPIQQMQQAAQAAPQISYHAPAAHYHGPGDVQDYTFQQVPAYAAPAPHTPTPRAPAQPQAAPTQDTAYF
eukprot:TRINITY_DN37306_c0_g1_i1.p1 TRINITY_DN37306_c0_g1~~TRINITY_DN37306_c0_g1_i1.p1  ORF type:complete len:746 (+),score=171.32 TRINITY_DN37306_c0_g1_i1:44-2281(+)